MQKTNLEQSVNITICRLNIVLFNSSAKHVIVKLASLYCLLYRGTSLLHAEH